MILEQRKLINLADALVPINFRENTPQFYELVKAFLANIQSVQNSINNNFLDTIDVNKIRNEDITRIYLDTYCAQFHFDSDVSAQSLNQLIRVSKDLSTKKGTSMIYSILTKLLVYLLPGIGTTYTIKLNEYNDATDEIVKAELEVELRALEESFKDYGIVQYYDFNSITGEPQLPEDNWDENIIPFRYRIETDYERYVFEKYFKPFCHPLGFEIEFVTNIYRYSIDSANLYCNFRLWDCFILPEVEISDDGNYISQDGINIETKYPFNYIKPVVLGDYDYMDFLELQSKVSNPNSLDVIDNKIVYTFQNFGLEEPYVKGDVNAKLRIPIGEYSDNNKLDYYLQSPRTDNLLLVGQKYLTNNKISSINGGTVTNNGNNVVVYKQIISNKKV